MTSVVYHLVPTDAAKSDCAAAQLGELAGLEHADHKVMAVAGRALGARRIEADVIVSHLPIRWKTFPFLVALRAANPDLQILHVQRRPGTRRDGPGDASRIPLPLRHSALALFDKVIWNAEAA